MKYKKDDIFVEEKRLINRCRFVLPWMKIINVMCHLKNVKDIRDRVPKIEISNYCSQP